MADSFAVWSAKGPVQEPSAKRGSLVDFVEKGAVNTGVYYLFAFTSLGYVLRK